MTPQAVSSTVSSAPGNDSESTSENEGAEHVSASIGAEPTAPDMSSVLAWGSFRTGRF